MHRSATTGGPSTIIMLRDLMNDNIKKMNAHNAAMAAKLTGKDVKNSGGMASLPELSRRKRNNGRFKRSGERTSRKKKKR